MPESDYQTEVARDFLQYVPASPRIRRWIASSALVRRLFFAGKKVLVVGCGRGKDCSYFVEYGASEVHGLDVCEEIGADFRHPRVRYHRCSAEKMELDSDAFDFVYSVATMEHIPHIDLAFSEMVRVTRPRGTIYCFASPLWNSREGHHKFGLFPGEPWIHLRMSKDQLVEHCRRNGVRSPDGRDIADEVEFIFSDYFNRQPAARYVEVCQKLPVSTILENAASAEPAEVLPEPVLNELAPRGYTPEELLTVWHKFVARK